jgi:hypothetical protein
VSRRGRNNSPWRNLDSLTLPGSVTIAPHDNRSAYVSIPAASAEDTLGFEVIIALLAEECKAPRVVRICEGEGCGTVLTRYNRGFLCFACKEREAKFKRRMEERAAQVSA